MVSGEVAVLELRDRIDVDAGRLAEIIAELGEAAAQKLIIAALEQLASVLCDAMRAAQNDQFSDVAGHVELMARLGWQLGLQTLAGVASDVARAAESRDGCALAATLARLERVSNQSLTLIWDSDLGPAPAPVLPPSG